MKKVICCLLVIAISLSLTACGGNSDKENSSNIDTIGLEMTEQEKMFESIKGSVITKVGSLDEMNDYDRSVTLEFAERYDITFEWIPMGYNEYVQKLPQMVAAGNPPDTAVMTDATSLSFMYNNLAQPLNDYIVEDDKYWDKDVLNSFSINGKYYGVNTGEIDTFFVYYNKTLFEELGLEDPYELYENGKWTNEKLREIAKEATQYESDKTTVSCYGLGTHAKDVFVLANGGNFINYDSDKQTYVSGITSAATIGGLNFLKDLCADGSFNPSIVGYTEFPARKIAMFIERPMHAIGNYDLLNTMKDEIGIVPMPQGPNADKLYAPSNLIVNFVPVNAQNPLGGMAWNYFWLRRLVEGQNQDNELWQARQYKMMTKEHEAIINDYLAKATKVSCKLESLSNWGNFSTEFWSDLVWNHKSAQEVSARMENIVNSALKNTIK